MHANDPTRSGAKPHPNPRRCPALVLARKRLAWLGSASLALVFCPLCERVVVVVAVWPDAEHARD